MKVSKDRALKILDFDIENRPLSYWYDGQTTAQITAIASCWVGYDSSMEVNVLTLDDFYGDEERQMLSRFVERYNEADMVTGHYIRKHDLPHINAALMDNNMSMLQPKLVCDTRIDLIKRASLPATQEHLAVMLGLDSTKFGMSQQMWRQANRLTPEGVRLTMKRVSDDVEQHMKLRQAMLDAGWLHGPKVWRS